MGVGNKPLHKKVTGSGRKLINVRKTMQKKNGCVARCTLAYRFVS